MMLFLKTSVLAAIACLPLASVAADADDALRPIARGEDGWVESGWLGTVWVPYFPWVFQEDAGWLYLWAAEDSAETYLYWPTAGWVWMTADSAPSGYYFTTASWIYWDAPTRNEAWVYDLEDWVDLSNVDALLTLNAISGVRLAEEKLSATLQEFTRRDRYPHGIQPNGLWQQDTPSSWVSGFFPGALWILYELTGDVRLSGAAAERMAAIEVNKDLTNTHDLGFMVGIPFMRAFSATGDANYRGVVMDAAESLASRFRPAAGIIDAWNWGRYGATTETIIDCMMNLEMLFWATEQPGGKTAWWELSLVHAESTLNQFFCDNGGVTHIVHFDPVSGAVVERERDCTVYPDDELFSRGHAWAIYGYIMAYRFTEDPRYLDTALKTLEFFMDAADADGIVAWSIAPGTPGSDVPDSSATAITCAALFELSAISPDPDQRARAWDLGRELLVTLLSTEYLGTAPGNGLLHHGTSGSSSRVDTALIYGDYYLLEAVERFLKLKGHAIHR